MTYDEFIAALQNPAVSEMELKAMFIAADASEQLRIIEALPDIAMRFIETENTVRLIEVLGAFIEFSKEINSSYRGDELALYWKEHAIAVLLYGSALGSSKAYAHGIFSQTGKIDSVLLVKSFEKIIEQLLKQHPLNLSQIKDEYGTYLLSSIIKKYPNLFSLVLELGASVNGEVPIQLNGRHRLYRSHHPVTLRFPLEGESDRDLIYVDPDRTHPLVVCIAQLALNPLSNQLRAILCELFNHPELNQALDCVFFRYEPLAIARHLGVFDVAKEAMLSLKMPPFQNKFIGATLNDENNKVSLSPYAYGLSRQEVPGDGDCLYHAIALHSDRTAHDLRFAVADYIEAGHLNDYLVLGHTQQSYAALVRAGAWGDHVEITALMRILGRPVVVLHDDGSLPTMPERMNDFPGAPIFISYNGVNHYTGLHPSRGNTPQDILSQMFPLMQRLRSLPGVIRMHLFGFFALSERISIVRNTQFDVQSQALEASILNSCKKRKAPDTPTFPDAKETAPGSEM